MEPGPVATKAKSCNSFFTHAIMHILLHTSFSYFKNKQLHIKTTVNNKLHKIFDARSGHHLHSF